MKDYRRRDVALAVGLSGVAGYVDAIGFLKLGGFFVSFMSGNSTRLGVGIATGQWTMARTALALIGLFVVGVVLGALVARKAGEDRRSVILALVAALLAIAAALISAGFNTAGVAAMVLAMGAENAVFQRDGDVGLGLTYMTGALVKAGQRIATALTGGDRWAWGPYTLLWAGLSLGGALGAAAYLWFGVLALWAAAALIAILAAAKAWRESLRG
ncbi:YoaK family protein [Caulobacter soli]|uniref:YoaK family protein n=1 Tax=Caulobacter soli TaxID=2708539 RepID=UPI0013E99F3F|nr:YoaK family protein [Caulobacter soli]